MGMYLITNNLKTCTRCELSLPLLKFGNVSGKPDKYNSKCKTCLAEYKKEHRLNNMERYKDNYRRNYEHSKEWRKEQDRIYRGLNKDVIKKRKSKYYNKNKKVILEKQRDYRVTNRDVIRTRSSKYRKKNIITLKIKKRKYYDANKSAILATRKNYRDNNRELIRERDRKWSKDNSAYRVSISNKRRASKVNATPDWYEKEKIELVYKKAKWLESITGLKYHVDHIIPLNNDKVCGLHVWSNLQILEAGENAKKGNKFN